MTKPIITAAEVEALQAKSHDISVTLAAHDKMAQMLGPMEHLEPLLAVGRHAVALTDALILAARVIRDTPVSPAGHVIPSTSPWRDLAALRLSTEPAAARGAEGGS